jgi:putative restriction endonuclease
MANTLNTEQLLKQVLRSVDESGWRAIIRDPHKPFHFRLFHGDDHGFDVCIYIWNCTHGGGAARSSDEYRVQVTSVVPVSAHGETTLLLGWHSGYGVFVGFDISKHEGQSSHSPSIQVKEETLIGAHSHAFAIYYRQNGEIAVAFRPEFLVDYALNASSLHSTGKVTEDLSLLNQLDTLTESQIVTVEDRDRRIVLSQMARKYRATDFRRRVLGAYNHRCAACGIQLELIDAAHIIPVAAPTSTDETKNGIAFCKLHHAAFDRNLLSFDIKYKIEISESEIFRLATANLAGGLDIFKKKLRTAIILPNDRRDYPPPQYIDEARKVRNWI